MLQPGWSHLVDNSSVLWSYQYTGLQILADEYMPQFCFWERFPGSSVLGMVSFIISIGDSLNPCSAVSSGALTHTFAFIVRLCHSFCHETLQAGFIIFLCRVFTFLHLNVQLITMFINSKFLLFYLLAKHITKTFIFHHFPPKCQY